MMKIQAAAQGELLSRRLQRDNDGLNEELNAAQGEIVDSIGRKCSMFWIATPAKMVTWPCSTRPRKAALSSTDRPRRITQDVVRLYDQAYPVKAAPPLRQWLQRRNPLLRLPLRQRSLLRNAFAANAPLADGWKSKAPAFEKSEDWSAGQTAL